MTESRQVFAFCIAAIFSVASSLSSRATADDWESYGGDVGGGRFSSSTQITPANVHRLEIVWTARTGELERRGEDGLKNASFQATPILLPQAAGGYLALCSPFSRVVALDPETGKEIWHFEPGITASKAYSCRGVAYLEDQLTPLGALCRHRIIAGLADLRIVALDAATGRSCPDFGDDGIIHVEPLAREESVTYENGDLRFISPPAIVNGVIVQGSSKFIDNKRVGGPSGAIRAFDGHSGQYLWSFHPIPRDDETAQALGWPKGSAPRNSGGNAWSLMSVDEARNLVFVPTASASPDFYGGERPGDDHYANSTVALNADDGSVAWHFQNIHHDVWDLDTPAQPMVVDLAYKGESRPAILQLTKQGLIFALDRETGEPIIPVEERPVPQGGVPGEVLSPTQPFPIAPPRLTRDRYDPTEAHGVLYFDRKSCESLMRKHRFEGLFTPPSLVGTVQQQSVMNWSGGAFDPGNQILVTNVASLFTIIRLLPIDEWDPDMQPTFGQPLGPYGGTPYAALQTTLTSPFMLPCNPPPWSELVAIDMTQGRILWQSTLGRFDRFMPIPLPELKWGTMGTAGGPIITAGGVIFIGGTGDRLFRAFDLKTGQELWSAELPESSAQATPMTYMRNGRQYVVVAAGGHTWLSPFDKSDQIIAFALPN